MTCDEGRTAAFLNGELSDAEEQAFDEHLLSCESCWWAVQEDRAGRLAVEQLRAPAPLGLADRVTASIGLAGKQAAGGAAPRAELGAARRRSSWRRATPTDRNHAVPGGRHRGRRAGSHAPGRLAAAAAMATVLAVTGGALGWVLTDHPAGDPPQIARVAAMDSPAMADSPALRSGEHFDFGGQSLDVRSYRIEGVITLVATSASPFPMPASSHLVTGSSPTSWMATDGKLAMYGVNRPAGEGRKSMFLIAAMPMARLPQVAARLHLI